MSQWKRPWAEMRQILLQITPVEDQNEVIFLSSVLAIPKLHLHFSWLEALGSIQQWGGTTTHRTECQSQHDEELHHDSRTGAWFCVLLNKNPLFLEM